MLRYDILRALSGAVPIAFMYVVAWWLMSELTDANYAVLITLLGILPAATLLTWITGFWAGTEQPQETHEACDPAYCIHARHTPTKGRHHKWQTESTIMC